MLGLAHRFLGILQEGLEVKRFLGLGAGKPQAGLSARGLELRRWRLVGLRAGGLEERRFLRGL